MTTKRFGTFSTAAAMLAMVAAPISAKSANDLRDLVGARAAGGETDLQNRGWVSIEGHKGGNASYTYWWNGQRKDCVMVTTRDGKYSSITDAKNADCNQKEQDNTGAAVAAGVGIAAIAALALSHKSGHHNDGQHTADVAAEQQYERGYRDGLYGGTYHNYDRSDSYSSGYTNGVEERGHNLSHQTQHSRYSGGYAPSVGVSDLNGARASSADSELTKRGFRNVDGFKSGNTSYTIWALGRQCLQMTVADGRVSDIRDIGTHPKCAQ